MQAATSIRSFQNNVHQYAETLLAEHPEIKGRIAICDDKGYSSNFDPELSNRVCKESFRWGEPHLLWQDEDHLLLGIAFSQNQKFTGGVILHDIPVPENNASAIFKHLQQIGKDWMTWLIGENVINESLMQRQKLRSREERYKAEAIHELKETSNIELRKQFGNTEPELMLAVRRGDRPEARKLLNILIMQAYNLAGDDFFQVRALLAELLVLLRATAREYASAHDNAHFFQIPFWETLREIHDEEDLSQWLRNMLESTMDFIASSAVSPGKLRAKLVLDYMRLNCAHPLSRNEVASKAGLSEAEFSRMIRRETGKTFSQHLTLMRIDEACGLLRNSRLSIQEIAFACGYEEASYFSNVFKRSTGTTPSRFRTNKQRGL